MNVGNISICHWRATYLGTHLDEGADVQRDHGRAPVSGRARVVTNTFLAPGAYDHHVEPHKVKGIHLAEEESGDGGCRRRQGYIAATVAGEEGRDGVTKMIAPGPSFYLDESPDSQTFCTDTESCSAQGNTLQ